MTHVALIRTFEIAHDIPDPQFVCKLRPGRTYEIRLITPRPAGESLRAEVWGLFEFPQPVEEAGNDEY